MRGGVMAYKDPEKAKEYRLRWREENREKVKERDRRYYEENREKVVFRKDCVLTKREVFALLNVM
jgi:hypothetical protein